MVLRGGRALPDGRPEDLLHCWRLSNCVRGHVLVRSSKCSGWSTGFYRAADEMDAKHAQQ